MNNSFFFFIILLKHMIYAYMHMIYINISSKNTLLPKVLKLLRPKLIYKFSVISLQSQ